MQVWDAQKGRLVQLNELGSQITNEGPFTFHSLARELEEDTKSHARKPI